MTTSKEQKFYKALQDVFIGAKIEGQGGFVNLMSIKSKYYRNIEGILKNDIETALKTYPSFRDELFDKLYSFFKRYFTEAGQFISIQHHSITTSTKRFIPMKRMLSSSGKRRCSTMLKLTGFSGVYQLSLMDSNSILMLQRLNPKKLTKNDL